MSEDLKKAIEKTVDKILAIENTHRDLPILKTNDPAEIRKVIDAALPQNPVSFDALLTEFEHQIAPFLNRNTSPKYAAYITGSGNDIGPIAEFIKGFYNQNALKWNNSPIANELEQLVIRWVADFIKLPAYNKGFITSGGSMSNLMALHLALAKHCPEREQKGFYNQQALTVYCSNQTHSSIERAMVFLGLGRDYLRKIEVNDRYQMDVPKLKSAIEKDIAAGLKPLAIIANAGTTNTGSIDDLEAVGEIARQFNIWYHVDGAYGLPARALENHFEKFNGVELADSIIINPHKWMYVPFEASCVLVKEIPKAIHFEPDYLYTENRGARQESSEHTIELSKEFKALKIWFTLKYYGAKQLGQFVENDIKLIAYLGEQLGKHEHIEIEKEHPLSILCFRWFDPSISEEANEKVNINTLRRIEKEGAIFITGTKLKGKTYLRAYFGNPNRTKEDVDYMVSKIIGTFKRTIH
ncbi:pyridoxal-dependent decarboxylase [Fulvivirga sp.]|uniref:pyridoxal phosphate-dependent decarboxylase family protein n=1 Tax=Fulvivirga sp. TaxID=1931237 RepID=UPI0032EDCE67